MVSREIFSYKPWVLALALLVTRVLADDHHVSVAADDLALVTDLLNAGVYLHGVSLFAVFVSALCGSLLLSAGLFVSVDDTTAGQVVWAQLYNHLVFGKNSDVVLAHLARNVGKNLVTVGQLNAEHGIG